VLCAIASSCHQLPQEALRTLEPLATQEEAEVTPAVSCIEQGADLLDVSLAPVSFNSLRDERTRTRALNLRGMSQLQLPIDENATHPLEDVDNDDRQAEAAAAAAGPSNFFQFADLTP
jgi:hypothetical protein